MIKPLLFCFLLVPSISVQSQCVNILQNPAAEEGLTGWDFTSEEDSSWEVLEGSDGDHTFTSSYGWSTKSQLIDLTTNYSNDYLDSEPEIYVQEMYKGHTTTNTDDFYLDNYYFHVELRDAAGNVLNSFEDGSKETPLTASKFWQTSNHTFSSYGSGLRFIYIESGGSDTENWVGFYGTRTDSAEVKVTPNKSLSINGATIHSNADNSTYQWLDCDNNSEPIPGEIHQSYTATTSGNYAVQITYNNCVVTSECQLVNSVSIFENDKEPLIEIYPNPSSGHVSIDLGDRYKDVTIVLKSISGQIISQQFFNNAKNINLEIDQAAGLYLIETKIGSNKNSSLMRIVK